MEFNPIKIACTPDGCNKKIEKSNGFSGVGSILHAAVHETICPHGACLRGAMIDWLIRLGRRALRPRPHAAFGGVQQGPGDVYDDSSSRPV
jgi:hypothetical protein